MAAASWISLLPAFGPQERWMSTTGVLKLARGAELTVERSAIAFLDEQGRVIAELADAFGLVAGARLPGPLSQKLHDRRPRPPVATAMRWTLNDRQTPAVPKLDVRADAGELSLWCAPLHVPVREDHQLFVHYVNLTDHKVDLCAAVRGAILWVDGAAHPSMTGWHWDGRGDVQAGGWSHREFRMSDFRDAPLLGAHEIAVEMFGQRTLTQSVLLEGEPWQPPP